MTSARVRISAAPVCTRQRAETGTKILALRRRALGAVDPTDRASRKEESAAEVADGHRQLVWIHQSPMPIGAPNSMAEGMMNMLTTKCSQPMAKNR